MALNSPYEPVEVSEVKRVFPALVVDEMMPAYDDIPEEFKEWRGTKWNQIFNTWFFDGLPNTTEFLPKEGIDPTTALRHISTVMGSFEPKHEHKEAACAYLMSLWFEDVNFSTEQEAPNG